MSQSPFAPFITVVSGLPRSGTSMMMKMIEAGGLEVVQDGQRTADEDNPKGYYEFEPIKQIDSDQSWLPGAVGKVLKAISFLLIKLPPSENYKVIFMERAIPEVLASQRKMLLRRGENPDEIPDERMTTIYEKHLADVRRWIDSSPNVDAVFVPYGDVVENPRPFAEAINALLGGILDVDAMVAVADPKLYRNRA
jgi:hypothetical protein